MTNMKFSMADSLASNSKMGRCENEGQPFFTVIICTYNRAKLLTRAINSLRRQKERDFEAIVVDDGSIDETQRLVRDYAAKHNWIRLVSHEQNEGVAAARNTGIKHSRGKFITFLDSDDEYLSNHLSERKCILESDPQIEFIHGGLRIVGDPFVPDKNNLSNRIHVQKCAVGGTFVISRLVFDQIGYFENMSYAEDSEFFERAKSNGIQTKTSIAPTYVYYRNTSNQVTNQRSIGHKLIRKFKILAEELRAARHDWLRRLGRMLPQRRHASS